MATRSLRLHVNGTNYVVTGISDGTAYKDILCTIAKSKTEDEACSGLLTLTEMRQNKINAKRIRSPRICRKTSLTDEGMNETGEDKIGPRQSVERISRRRKESCSSKERLKTSKKEKEASPRRRERALDDSDIETFRRSRRKLKNQIKRKAREDSDVMAYQNLQKVATSPKRQNSKEKKQLGDRKYRSNDDVQKISIYYIDEKIDKSLLDYDDIARKACRGDSLLAKRKKSSSRQSATSVSELDRSEDLGQTNNEPQNTEDKDSGIPSWESEECSSKDGNKKEGSCSNYGNKREKSHSKDGNNSKESCSKEGTMQKERSSIERNGRGESSTEGVDKRGEERLSEVFERSLFFEFQRNLHSDLASKLGSSCPSLLETGNEGSKRMPQMSSSNSIVDNNGNECEIQEELLPVFEVEDDFCVRKIGELTSENSENSELYERAIEKPSKCENAPEIELINFIHENTEGDEIPSDFEEIRIPSDSSVNNDLRKKETSMVNAKKVDMKGRFIFVGKKGPKDSNDEKGIKELTGEKIKESQNKATTQQQQPERNRDTVSRIEEIKKIVDSKENVNLRDRERNLSYENRGSFLLIDFDETELTPPLFKSEVCNNQKDTSSNGSKFSDNKGAREKSEEISDLQSMGQTCSSGALGGNGALLNIKECKEEEREITSKVLNELDRSSRLSRESDCGSTASSSELGDFEMKRKAQSREGSCSSFESDNVPVIRNKRIVYVEKLSEKAGDSKQTTAGKREKKLPQKKTSKAERAEKKYSKSKEMRKISEGDYSTSRDAAMGNTDRLSKSLEAFSTDMDSALLKIDNFQSAANNLQIRKASKKSSRKSSKETATEDSKKQDKVEEQRSEKKNGLYQRQHSVVDEIEDFRKLYENSMKQGNGKGLFSWFKKKDKKSAKVTDNKLIESLTVQGKIANEKVTKVAGIGIVRKEDKIVGEKCSCGNDFDQNNNRRESSESQEVFPEVFEVDQENIDAEEVSMGSVCEREAAEETVKTAEEAIEEKLGTFEEEIENMGGRLKGDSTDGESITGHVRAESTTKENKGACRDDEGLQTAGVVKNIVATGSSMGGVCDALCKQRSNDNKTGDEGIDGRKIMENCAVIDENREEEKRDTGVASGDMAVKVTSDTDETKICTVGIENYMEGEQTENKNSEDMAVGDTKDLDRKKLWTEYREVCDKIIEIAEKLLYLDLILNQKKHELQEIRANELLYEDGALDHDEKLIVRDINDFRKYLKTVTLFSMRQREQLQENKQELEKLDRILRKKQSTLKSLENMVMFKRFHETPRQLLRKHAKTYVFKMSLPVGIEAL